MSLIHAKYHSPAEYRPKTTKTHPSSFRGNSGAFFFLLRRHYTQKIKIFVNNCFFFEKFSSGVQLLRIIIYRGSCKEPFAVVISLNDPKMVKFILYRTRIIPQTTYFCNTFIQLFKKILFFSGIWRNGYGIPKLIRKRGSRNVKTRRSGLST